MQTNIGPNKKLYIRGIKEHLKNTLDKWDDSNLELREHYELILSEGVALPHPRSGTAALSASLSHDSILLNYSDYFSNILLNH